MEWLEEILNGTLKVFLNPVFYWSFVLVLLIGYRRIKLEREQFNVKIFDLFAEWNRMIIPGIGIGLFISLVLIATGVIFTEGTLLVISLMMIILSLGISFSLLSPSYTIGLSFILLLFLPNLLEYQQVVEPTFFMDTNFLGLALLLGLLLLAEAFLMQRVRREDSFPCLTRSERGAWIGEHSLNKGTVIPLFLLVPGGMVESYIPNWPLLSVGEETYGLILFPFLLGFSHRVRSNLASRRANQLGKQIAILGLIVLLISISAYFVNGLSLAALLVAMIGREMVTYRFRLKEKREVPFFHQQEKGLRVLGIIPETPAARLDIQIGEKIVKVNDKHVNHPQEFYEALQGSGAYFKLDILDDNDEVRFVQSAFYETDHHLLGLLFVDVPHDLNKMTEQREEQTETEELNEVMEKEN